MIFIVIAAAALGAVYGALTGAVAARVFREEDEPLLTWVDLRRPLPAVPEISRRKALWLQLMCAALFAGAAIAIGGRWVAPAYVWFVAVTVTLTLTDLDRKLIPNRILFPGFLIGAVLLGLGALGDGDLGALGRAALGSAAFFGFLFVLALAARGGFGMGDVKLGAMLGAFLAFEGWDVLVVGGVGAFLLGGLVSLFLLAFRIRGRKDAIPFGPYMVLGAYVAIAAGGAIADWYRA